MSLKGFHLVFITVASLLFAFLVMWGFLFAERGDNWSLAIACFGVIGLLAMPLYGRYFLRKAARDHLD